MTESVMESLVMSNLSLRRPRRRNLEQAIKQALALLIALRGMDAHLLVQLLWIDAPGLLVGSDASAGSAVRVGGATRWHAAQDGLRLMDALCTFIAECTEMVGGKTAPALDTSKTIKTDRQARIQAAEKAERAQAAKVQGICEQAGLINAEAHRAAIGWVERVAGYMAGYDKHILGKEQQRRLSAIRTTSERLANTLASMPESEIGRAVGCLLPTVRANAERLLAEFKPRPQGRAEVPDPVAYGAEGLLSIWRSYHPNPPNLSRNGAGFPVFGEALLDVAASQFGPTRPTWIKPTTFGHALRRQVEQARLERLRAA